ncbi:RnfH family protein [Colwellia sp. Arc7-635]|jgi:putative ubiquitin-RnfH superfamily antitoxin RatB of RatAB toxin-antitoxin module|uniref:RnfH family protein n=1 Tax=Colwellia sp. Arc7-635 TaxID=2497879 RepID=UPI000F856378|nr:RnfH family protein [Colwellia sp. Arc7-635]AZQ85315.1 RnfH family protein [Colwellia sp. Arc7-635]
MSEQIMNEDSNVIEQLAIEVVYGTPTRQEIISTTVGENTTVEQAILSSGIVEEFPEIDLAVNNVGIWNRAVKLGDIVKDLDRIEVYRPLLADPKEVRKRRAEKAKEEGRADKVTGGRVDPRRSKAGEA